MGENLTTRGIDIRQIRIGDQIRAGGALLEITQPRGPCSALDVYGESLKLEIYDQKVKQRDYTSAALGHERLLRQRGRAGTGARGRRGIAGLQAGVTHDRALTRLRRRRIPKAPAISWDACARIPLPPTSASWQSPPRCAARSASSPIAAFSPSPCCAIRSACCRLRLRAASIASSRWRTTASGSTVFWAPACLRRSISRASAAASCCASCCATCSARPPSPTSPRNCPTWRTPSSTWPTAASARNWWRATASPGWKTARSAASASSRSANWAARSSTTVPIST